MINARKVYDLYTDRTGAKKNYKLKLPKLEWTNGYLDALGETDSIRRKDILLRYLKVLEDDLVFVPFFNRENPLDIDAFKDRLVTLNNFVCNTEELLLQEHPYATPLYFILLQELDNFIRNNTEVLPVDYDKRVDFAKSAVLAEDRIRVLENLFMIVDSQEKLDYDDFCIRQ